MLLVVLLADTSIMAMIVAIAGLRATTTPNTILALSRPCRFALWLLYHEQQYQHVL